MAGEMRISAAMCARGRPLADPRVSPDGRLVAFVTRGQVVVVPSAGGPELVVTADLAPAGRGGVVDWAPDGTWLAYATADGGLAAVPSTGGPGRVLAEGPDRAAPAVALDGLRVAHVVGTRRVEVVGGASFDGSADFAVDPSWSPGGDRLTWHEWDVPNMAWDESRIVVAPGAGGDPVTVAGGAGVSVQQPRFGPDGRLAFVSDATGWPVVWVARTDGRGARPLVDEAYEHAGPTWGPGQRSFAWSRDGEWIAFARNEEGFGRLCVAEVATREVIALARGAHSSITWARDRIVALRSGARTPTAVVSYDAKGERTVLARGPVGGFEAAELPEPEVVHWRAGDGAEVHGRLYAGGAGRPMIVWAHGGPTDQREVSFDARAAFFLERGWALLLPDPRGSTGWGRAYRQALHGGWGDLDVEDIAAGVRAAVAADWCDPRRVVVMGASSGGMAALLLLARHPALFAAGIDLYGVTDLRDLAASTHRYEAHYSDLLIGPLPEAEDLYRERSPITHAHRIAAPLLVLHGDADPVVPEAQSRRLVDAVRAAGGEVEHHVYPGEGHGWRSPATVEDELTRIESFLQRHVLR